MKLIRGLLRAGHRLDDCIQMLDEHLSTAGADRYWALIEVAVAFGETLPDPRVAEPYLR